MDPKIKTKWLAALRSGSYQQGQSGLRPSQKTFCCLGVLCDIVEPESWLESEGMYSHFEERRMDFPRPALFEKVGLSGDFAEGLADMNDNGENFSTIADTIERDL